MLKIAFLGAGSAGFGRKLVVDLLSFPTLAEATLHLVDPDAERLEFILSFARRLVEGHRLPTRFAGTTDRKPALDGAQYVIVSIRTGQGMSPEAMDVQIPWDVAGLRQTVADTVGVGGIMKGLRTIPVMLEIARDMERLCPHALLLNYTNPMAMIQWAVGAGTSIRTVGLCHSVQGTSKQLARYMGVDYERMRWRVAGINHMAWFLELAMDGGDLYPRLVACLEDPEAVAKDPVRFEILRHFGRFVTESSRHMAEYGPFFMKSEREMGRLDIAERSGKTFLDQAAQSRKQLESARKELATEVLDLNRSHEYAAQIIHAVETNSPCCIHGNVLNSGLITNLPSGCCVEVPCLIDRAGVQPCYVGDIPPQCAALCQTNVNMQELTVKAILEKNREHVYHAAMLDPNTSSQLTLREIRETIDRLMEAQADLIPDL